MSLTIVYRWRNAYRIVALVSIVSAAFVLLIKEPKRGVYNTSESTTENVDKIPICEALKVSFKLMNCLYVNLDHLQEQYDAMAPSC